MPESTSRKPIPVTLLSGFLGSGKTTLLERILTHDHGLKIAVIINDVSQINIDAALIQNHRVTQKEEKLIQLQNGCICCTLRGDLLEELATLALSGEFQYIVIESTGISEPMQVAETFTTEFSEMILQNLESLNEEEQMSLEKIVNIGGLNKIVQLDTCVTVIDAVNFLANFETTDFLADRFGDNGQGETERTITDLMVDQIEFSDIIIMNKVKGIKKRKQRKIEKLIKSLNPVAKIIPTNYCDVPIKDVVNTKLFDFEKLSASAGWLQSINEMTIRESSTGKSTLTPKPETEEYRINNFVYRNRKPFHPERLYKLIRDKYIVIEQSGFEDEEKEDEENEEEDDDEDDDEQDDEDGEEEEEEEDDDFVQPSNKQIIRNKKKSVFGPMLRSKGFFWLASRYINRGEWSSAGAMMTLKGGLPWFSVTGPEFYPPGVKELIEKDMQGKYGDRRNELVFIGVEIDRIGLSKALDECLLTDEEYDIFESIIEEEKNLFKIEKKLQATFNDGFADWIVYDDDPEKPT
ncbi:cobW-domain-containing protein [Hyphopichia burtonii NRRL Y-1933]|uniref:CobW-domain-containing protein n=1 Tax=Hyphopichia burtonii NRRL Y-1933 TaxID=984485 RepID=A0A1E4RBF9_9ASCO|nr:cobW-domain-containing protein [Hyphopichia burtonii NRRL Y-1933]ODV64607.1 cobW-domain-containing protein [Hyphopichia burtonii NRRL Y-1933]